ncbi:MAG: GNAT family N-acetyltransferase [Clostridia bacterium]|nr:GNAT family N-acetyltransferase [Clostridia bacterium]
MAYSLKQIDKKNYEIFKLLAAWDEDPEIKPFVIPRMSEEPIMILHPEEMMAYAIKNKKKKIYVLYDDFKPVGTCSIEKDFGFLTSPFEDTAWISIAIGEKAYWGTNAAGYLMHELENLAREDGFSFIELGVFSFNYKARRFYQKMGYSVYKIHPRFTFYENKWHDDYRMIKKL